MNLKKQLKQLMQLNWKESDVGIDFRDVQVVGCDYSKLTYKNLTDYGKSVVRKMYDVGVEHEDYEDIDEDNLEDWFDNEYKHCYLVEDANFETCGNGFSGDYYFAGVPFKVSLQGTQISIDQAVLQFNKYFNLIPEVLSGVDIY